ncbi:MAG: response regulator [Deltaproteobacteria bacterium]|nr:response regulator [Deltaproteobacteria bacterium]
MRKIIVVDDDKYMRKLLATILQTEGYDVMTVDNGADAVRQIALDPPALLILDYMMPGTTGVDVMREVKRNHPDVDIIVVTGHGNEKLAVEIMKLGASDYLQKPFRKKELLDSVHRVLGARVEYDKQIQGAKLLIVDDDKALTNFMKSALSGIGSIEAVNDPNAALALLNNCSYDVMICDIYMPYMDGIELLKRSKVVQPTLDVMVITSSDEMQKVRDAVKSGASDYIKKPFTQEVLREAVGDILLSRQKRVFDSLKKNFLFQELKEAERAEFLREIVEALIMALEARDPYTKGHSERVTEYSMIIGVEMGLTKDLLTTIRHSARLHDLGKIGTEDHHLYKMGALTSDEKNQVARHPELGSVILKSIRLLEDYIPGVRHHHERYDGKGYPDGLRGEEIPLIARIISVADAFDAMLSSRPYRKAMKIDDAVDQLQKFKGVQFDPVVVDALLNAIGSDAVRAIIEKAAAHA